jgi:GT2 family glycosyltransferase
MVSIITAVHNKLHVNRFYYDFLKKNTEGPYELIIIDNNSKDGTREFFQQVADKVIINNNNYSYPYCQNQGIKESKYDYLAFFNNDLLVSKGWDTKIFNIINKKNIDVVSFATNDHTENRLSQKKIQRKWKWIKYPVKFLLGTNYVSLKIMIYLTYCNFDKFCEKRYIRFGDETIEGYSGSCILMKKSVIDKIGLWDERIQKADFDLFNKVKVRSIEYKDIKPVQLAVGIYMHHFKGLTTDFEQFADKNNMIKLDEKWGDKTRYLRKDIIG